MAIQFLVKLTIKKILEYSNHFCNILRLFKVLQNFPFATTETMGDYYLYKHGILELFHKLPNGMTISS